MATTIDEEMEFGAESAAGASEDVIGGFMVIKALFSRAPAAARLARMSVPSMFHCCQSSCPSVSKVTWSAVRMRSQVSSRRQSTKRSHKVFHDP